MAKILFALAEIIFVASVVLAQFGSPRDRLRRMMIMQQRQQMGLRQAFPFRMPMRPGAPIPPQVAARLAAINRQRVRRSLLASRVNPLEASMMGSRDSLPFWPSADMLGVNLSGFRLRNGLASDNSLQTNTLPGISANPVHTGMSVGQPPVPVNATVSADGSTNVAGGSPPPQGMIGPAMGAPENVALPRQSRRMSPRSRLRSRPGGPPLHVGIRGMDRMSPDAQFPDRMLPSALQQDRMPPPEMLAMMARSRNMDMMERRRSRPSRGFFPFQQPSQMQREEEISVPIKLAERLTAARNSHQQDLNTFGNMVLAGSGNDARSQSQTGQSFPIIPASAATPNAAFPADPNFSTQSPGNAIFPAQSVQGPIHISRRGPGPFMGLQPGGMVSQGMTFPQIPDVTQIPQIPAMPAGQMPPNGRGPFTNMPVQHVPPHMRGQMFRPGMPGQDFPGFQQFRSNIRMQGFNPGPGIATGMGMAAQGQANLVPRPGFGFRMQMQSNVAGPEFNTVMVGNPGQDFSIQFRPLPTDNQGQASQVQFSGNQGPMGGGMTFGSQLNIQRPTQNQPTQQSNPAEFTVVRVGDVLNSPDFGRANTGPVIPYLSGEPSVIEITSQSEPGIIAGQTDILPAGDFNTAALVYTDGATSAGSAITNQDTMVTTLDNTSGGVESLPPMPSPLNQDFSFFAPTPNINTEHQSGTFNINDNAGNSANQGTGISASMQVPTFSFAVPPIRQNQGFSFSMANTSGGPMPVPRESMQDTNRSELAPDTPPEIVVVQKFAPSIPTNVKSMKASPRPGNESVKVERILQDTPVLINDAAPVDAVPKENTIEKSADLPAGTGESSQDKSGTVAAA